jgi:hypothetical protein
MVSPPKTGNQLLYKVFLIYARNIPKTFYAILIKYYNILTAILPLNPKGNNRQTFDGYCEK